MMIHKCQLLSFLVSHECDSLSVCFRHSDSVHTGSLWHGF